MNIIKLNAWLLLIAGVILLIPGLYVWLTQFTKEYPWIQIFLGILSIAVSGVIIIKKMYQK